jgi:transketolase
MRPPPYRTVLKPYGLALLDLAKRTPEIVCVSGDLTRQCEVDLFRDELPDRFINVGMAEANMVGIAGGLARRGFIPFVHTFGVFATRRPYDQVAMAIAYPSLPVRLVGFMPGVSSPGGPSHQAIDDVALMRALPNMTVVDVADAVEVGQAVEAIAYHPGPVYLRLKRGETPVIFDDEHEFRLDRAHVLERGEDVAVIASGMMVSVAIAAATALEADGVSTAVVNVPVLKPLDGDTLRTVCAGVRGVVTVENHSIVGGLGSAVSETLAEAGMGRPLRRLGLQDTFAEAARDAAYLFWTYGLSTQAVIDAAWSVAGRSGPGPRTPAVAASPGEYAPV